ncbi:hypothetical protein GCM10027614_15070 [Micromonospora vulcania]
MFGQTSTTTPPPTDRGLEDLDAAALAYAARIEGLPPERRGEARDDLVRFALPFAGRLARRYRGAASRWRIWSRWPGSAW